MAFACRLSVLATATFLGGPLVARAEPLASGHQARNVSFMVADQQVSGVASLQIEVGGHAGAVRRVAVAEDRNLVVTSSDDKTARVWALAGGALIRTLRVPVGAGDQGRLYGAAIHPKRNEVAVAGTGVSNGPGAATDAFVYVFNTDTGELLRRFKVGTAEVKRLAWSRDGAVLAVGAAGAGRGLYVFGDGGERLGFWASKGDVYGLAMGAETLVATDMAGALMRVKLGGNPMALDSPVATGSNPVSVDLSPDGSKAVVGHFSSQMPQVIDLRAGRVERTLAPAESDLNAGVLMTVAWSRLGETIHAGGSKADRNLNYPMWTFDAASGRGLARADVASDSVLDLAALSGGGVVFTSFDGSWGVADQGKVTLQVKSPATAFQAAQALKLDAPGRRASWVAAGGRRVQFDVGGRALVADRGDTSTVPLRKHPDTGDKVVTSDAKGWLRHVEIGGRRVELQASELAKSATFVPKSGDAAVGTSMALYRMGPKGEVRWRVPTGTEVNDVVSTAAGGAVVSAMSDGTLRWWRFEDGALLMSLLVAKDGSWVVWTPEGFFDSSAGAEALVGWLVARGDQGAVEMHSLTRFRQEYRRPDVIDQVLAEVAGGTKSAPAPASALKLPPFLAPRTASAIRVEAGQVSLSYSLRADQSQPPILTARLNGRPWPAAQVTLPEKLDGNAVGQVSLKVPSGKHWVQLQASDTHGTSDPIAFTVDGGSPKREAPGTAGSAPKPRLLVLAVGVSEYLDRKLSLGLPAKDAADFVATVQRQQGKRYREVQIRTLADAAATRQGFLDGLKWLNESSHSEDVVMVFMAGHGVNDATGRYYFLPTDGDPGALQQSGISEIDLRDGLAKVRARTVLFADTCHAGSIAAGDAKTARDQARLASEMGAPENGVMVLAASTRVQESLEHKDWGNGAFTKAVVSGLKGKADPYKTGKVSVKGLDYFVSVEVGNLTGAVQNPVSQIPAGMPDLDLVEL